MSMASIEFNKVATRALERRLASVPSCWRRIQYVDAQDQYFRSEGLVALQAFLSMRSVKV